VCITSPSSNAERQVGQCQIQATSPRTHLKLGDDSVEEQFCRLQLTYRSRCLSFYPTAGAQVLFEHDVLNGLTFQNNEAIGIEKGRDQHFPEPIAYDVGCISSFDLKVSKSDSCLRAIVSGRLSLYNGWPRHMASVRSGKTRSSGGPALGTATCQRQTCCENKATKYTVQICTLHDMYPLSESVHYVGIGLSILGYFYLSKIYI